MSPTITPAPGHSRLSLTTAPIMGERPADQPVITAAPADVVRRHREACQYMIVSCVLLILAIIFFATGHR